MIIWYYRNNITWFNDSFSVILTFILQFYFLKKYLLLNFHCILFIICFQTKSRFVAVATGSLSNLPWIYKRLFSVTTNLITLIHFEPICFACGANQTERDGEGVGGGVGRGGQAGRKVEGRVQNRMTWLASDLHIPFYFTRTFERSCRKTKVLGFLDHSTRSACA